MRYWLYGLVFAMCLAMIGIVHITRGWAHSWYPPECCHQMDCAPVTSTSYVAGSEPLASSLASSLPLLVVSTRHGTAVVPHNFPVRSSPDGQVHACLRPHPVTHAMQVICLFLPPSL